MGYEPVPRSDIRVREALAGAMADFGDETAGIVYSLAPHKTERYRRSIGSTTYLDGSLVSGKALRKNIGHWWVKGDILTVVYSSNPLAWLLEFGTAPHTIGKHNPGGIISDAEYDFFVRLPFAHPGSRKSPHFGPAAMASLSSLARVVLAGYTRRMR